MITKEEESYMYVVPERVGLYLTLLKRPLIKPVHVVFGIFTRMGKNTRY